MKQYLNMFTEKCDEVAHKNKMITAPVFG